MDIQYMEQTIDSLITQIDEHEEKYRELFGDLKDLMTLVAAEKGEAARDMCEQLGEQYGIEVEYIA
jgi:ATP-dependent exoDNAse (exonuclease V) alpha subunit